MSTDKFHINDAAPGNDTHSNFLRRMGYGDLLNRPGRQEMTIDTASMYKSAGDAGNALTGAGVAAGGLAGSLVADYTNAGALGRLIMTLAGAGAGGFGGRMLGEHLDKSEVDGIPMSRKHRQAVNAATIGSIGALAGYGTSKYLVGSKNNLYNLLGAATGGSIGALVGSRIGAPDGDNWNEYTEQEQEAAKQADKLGLKGDQRNNFIRDYTASIDREKDNEGVADWIKSVIGRNPTEMDKVIAKYKGEEEPVDSWTHPIKTPIAAIEGYHALKHGIPAGSRAIQGKTPGSLGDYLTRRAKWWFGSPATLPNGKFGWNLPEMPRRLIRYTVPTKYLKLAARLLSKGRIRL